MLGRGEDGILQIFSLSGRRVLVELQRVHSIRVRRCCVSGAFPLFSPSSSSSSMALILREISVPPTTTHPSTHRHKQDPLLRVWELMKTQRCSSCVIGLCQGHAPEHRLWYTVVHLWLTWFGIMKIPFKLSLSSGVFDELIQCVSQYLMILW